jgi:hypothetical protein
MTLERLPWQSANSPCKEQMNPVPLNGAKAYEGIP